MATPSASVLARLKLLREELATRQPAQEAYKKAMREVPYAEQPTFEQWLALPEQKTYRLPAALVGSAALAGADSMRATPEQNPNLAWLAKKLGQVDEFARKPFGYDNPPAVAISSFLGAPAINSLADYFKANAPVPMLQDEGQQLRSRFPQTYGALAGLLGSAPDEMEGSVLEPGHAERKAGADKTFALGTLLQMLPMAPATKGLPVGAIIKPKGLSGNWLRETAEHALSGLKSPEPPWENTALSDVARILGLSKDELSSQRAWRQGHGTIRTPAGERDLQEALSSINPPRTPDPVNSWVDNQLVEYVKSDMATPTDPVRLAIEAWPEKKKGLQELAQAKLDFLNAKTQRLMHERNTPEAHLTRHRQEIIAAEKAKERIDLQEGLHFAPTQETDWIPQSLQDRRQLAGFPPEGVAVSDLAKKWELPSDSLIQTVPAGRYQKEVGPGWDLNLWLDKVGADTTVYSPMPRAEQTVPHLGFDHLIDELRNATDAASGLPKDLLLNPAALSKVTVPQAIEHVAKINAWRGAQKAEANMARANNAATHLHKHYPHSAETPNPKGLRWVELKIPERLPEGWTDESIDSHMGHIGQFRDPKTAGLTLTDPRITAFQDAVKYEGDTLGHSVGGYAYEGNYGLGGLDAIKTGKAKIYSLRDAKGQPHATVEVQPGKMPSLTGGFEELPEDAVAAAKAAMPRGDFQHGPLVRKWIADNWKGELTESPSSILQIKGFKNLKPADEYLPFVQDFVKSGKWSGVRDTENAGLHDITDSRSLSKLVYDLADFLPKGGTGAQTQHLKDLLEANNASRFVSREEALKLLDTPPPPVEGFAHGGSVYNPARVDEIIAQHRNSEYDPARVDDLVAQLKEEMYA